MGEDHVEARVGRKNVATVRPRFPLAVDVAQPPTRYVKIDQLVSLLHDGEGGAASYILNRGRVRVSEDHITRALGWKYFKVAWIHFIFPRGVAIKKCTATVGVGCGTQVEQPSRENLWLLWMLVESPRGPLLQLAESAGACRRWSGCGFQKCLGEFLRFDLLPSGQPLFCFLQCGGG